MQGLLFRLGNGARSTSPGQVVPNGAERGESNPLVGLRADFSSRIIAADATGIPA